MVCYTTCIHVEKGGAAFKIGFKGEKNSRNAAGERAPDIRWPSRWKNWERVQKKGGEDLFLILLWGDD